MEEVPAEPLRDLAALEPTLASREAYGREDAAQEAQVSVTIDGEEYVLDGTAIPGKRLPRTKVSWQSDHHLRFALKGIRAGQVAAMCAAVGLSLVSLRRIRIGRVPLARLPEGQWRYLQGWERF